MRDVQRRLGYDCSALRRAAVAGFAGLRRPAGAPAGVELSSACESARRGRVRREHGRETIVAEGADNVERLGRRARAPELDEVHRLFEPDERVGQAVRRAADAGSLGIGRELALGREGDVHEARRDGSEDEQEGPLEPAADPACLDQPDCEHDDRRLQGDVRRRRERTRGRGCPRARPAAPSTRGRG